MKDYENNDQSLIDIILQFVGDKGNPENKRDIRVIDISSLPSEVAGILTSTISRLIFQYKLEQERKERGEPNSFCLRGST